MVAERALNNATGEGLAVFQIRIPDRESTVAELRLGAEAKNDLSGINAPGGPYAMLRTGN
jgi:hypothetical protein